ncbi:ead/Ea22-like family protein [Escherichia coli]|uniref:ead/Ea22-like family protein n=1 Tax=Escherichia coli TaxID=562 RepID=UPI0001E9642D|nr:ead/Ea22-like family protein [Escherichia coli]EFR18890.1 ead protein [Escherichia coli 2362-75]
MSKIDHQALREAAEQAMHDDWGFDADLFHELVTPSIVLELLDEQERNQQYIKRRDQENEDIALTVGKLLIENGQLVADTLRHLADNEIDSDYFAITSTNENGTEIDHEMAITDYALQAAGTVDELVAALESAEKRIAELSASHSKLRDTMAGIHNTIRMDGGYTPLTAILNAAKRAYEESASAAGIRIKGE